MAANLELGGFDGDWVSVAAAFSNCDQILTSCHAQTLMKSMQWLLPYERTRLIGTAACLQGLHTAKVKSKRALLVEEGVQFSGNRIKASCVVDAEGLLAAVAHAAA